MDDDLGLDPDGVPRRGLVMLGIRDPAAKLRLDFCRFLLKQLEAKYNDTMGEMAIEYARKSLEEAKSSWGTAEIEAAWMLVSLLMERFKTHGDISDVDECIALGHTTVALSLREEDEVLHVSYMDLAESLKARYLRYPDNELLSEMINVQRQAFEFCPEGAVDHYGCGQHLADSLSTLYNNTWDINLLEDAIEVQRKILNTHPEGHTYRARSCSGLASSLATRYEHAGGPIFLDEAIMLQRESLTLRPSGHPDRADSCSRLASSLSKEYARTGDIQLLTEAIELERESLALRPVGHEHRVYPCGNLGYSLWQYYQHKGDISILYEAIELQREAVQLCSDGHSMRAVYGGNLANSLWTYLELKEDLNLLTEAVDLHREALFARPHGHPLREISCANLAGVLYARFMRTTDKRLLEEAISLEREALVLCPVGHPHRGSHCNNLAGLLQLSLEQNMDLAVMNDAFNLYMESLNLISEGHPGHATTFANISYLLRKRFDISRDIKFLDMAITAVLRALAPSSKDHLHRQTYCASLARLLQLRYMNGTPDDDILKTIVALCQEALTPAISTPHHEWLSACPLAWVYLQRTSSLYDINKSITYISMALEHEPHVIPVAVAEVVRNVNGIWASKNSNEQHVALIPIYQRLIELLPLLSNAVLDVQSQVDALGHCSRVGFDAFVNATLAGDWKSGLENLELTQGIIWSQHLHQRYAQLEHVPEPQATELEGLLRAASMPSLSGSYQGARSALTPQDMRHIQTARVYALVKEIRELPGLDRFMLGETYESLCAVASLHPVVILVAARGHSYALIMSTSHARDHVLLPIKMTEDDTMGISPMFGLKRASRGETNPEDTDVQRALRLKRPHQSSHWNHQMRVIWTSVVQPVIEHLGLQQPLAASERPRLHWCLTGSFSTIPIHAAGIYEGTPAERVCCADYFVSSYAPTLTALLRAQRSAPAPIRQSLSIALIAEKQAYNKSLQAINGVVQEIRDVAAVAQQRKVHQVRQLIGSTTVADTCTAMQNANIVHLACHGIQDTMNATESGFCLGNGRLSISKLMDLQIQNAFLAFLSACETAKGDKFQPDQAMHLAAAMLFCGYPNVVATMWAISDLDGPEIAKWFYEDLLSKEVIDSDSVAYALDTAVSKLRDSGVTPERWAPFVHMGA